MPAWLLDVVRHVAQRVALRHAPLVGNVFVAARKAHRLEAQEADLLRVVQRELDDVPHLLVVDPVDDRRHRHNLHAGFVQVVNRLQLHIKQVAHLAVRVGRVANAVELKIHIPQSRFGSRAAKLLALRELNAVRGRLHAVVAHLARVSHRIQKVRRKRRLAAD